LPIQRWQAHPPPGVPRPPAPTRPRPYQGPPTYGTHHPSWGFPPVIWRRAGSTTGFDETAVPRRGLQVAAWAALITSVLCVAAAGAELWRWVLLLRGRTEVLPAGVVHTSDVAVGVAGVAAAVVGAVALVLALPAVVRTHGAADRLAGLAPSRRPAEVLARLVVPVWNFYGAGQVFAEIDGRLGSLDDDPDRPARPRASRLVLAWWIAWIANGFFVLVALGRAFGGSLQAIADTVEMHIVVDLLAALVAGLAAVLFRRWNSASVSRPDPYSGWVVAPPAPTRTAVPVAHDASRPPEAREGPQPPAEATERIDEERTLSPRR